MNLTFSITKKNLLIAACIQVSVEEGLDTFPKQYKADYLALNQANIYLIHKN